MTLTSYKNDSELKTKFVKEIEKHRKADQILQGTYGKENGIWRGCAVACSLRSLAIINKEELVTEYNQHSKYETELGIPEWLARLEDTIFEGLPAKNAKMWPTLFAKAIPVGVNLNPVKWKFCAFILKENIERVLKLDIKDELKEQVVKSIQQVLSVHEKAVTTGEWDESAAWAAESEAWSAAWAAESAARSAAWSAARSAWSAAWSAAWAAESAARSAAWAAESAESAYITYSKELLRLLSEAK